MSNFEVVDHNEVPETSRAGRGVLSDASKALLAGQTIWLKGKAVQAGRFVRMAKPRGYRVRTRSGPRNGAAGVYVWLEPLVQTPASEA